MNTKFKFLLLIVFSVLQLIFAQAASAGVDISECEAYRQRSDELQCSEDGYFINFGERYCQIFVEKNHRFTAHGQDVLAYLRTCLIESMQTDQNMTCDNAKDLAEDHHYNCYMESGYCSMGYYDRFHLGWIVRQQFFDPGFLLVSEKINRACTF